MNKIYLPSVTIFLIGIIVTIIGATFKIMHWPGASMMLLVGMMSEVIALVILIITLIKNSK